MKLGPGFLVTAAFVGPGTITTASVAGAQFGLALVWALVLSIVTTIIFQEMSLRLGVVTGKGLSEGVRSAIRFPAVRIAILGLVIVAIGIGNAAYQAGNLLGASLGAQTLTGLPPYVLIVGIVCLASTLLFSGIYRLIEGILMALVLIMAAVFVAAMLVNPPEISVLLSGLKPSLPPGGTLIVLALIGTTVVPYNLFLHANAAANKWAGEQDKSTALREGRRDLLISLTIGGMLTLAIMSTSASAFYGKNIDVNAATLASQLEPVLGNGAELLVAVGLLAAGLTSAITAPLAAAFAVCGAAGWPQQMNSTRFRAVWLLVMVSGAAFALSQTQPVTAIVVAQVANALLLPVIAMTLVIVMNSKLLGEQRNTLFSNLVGLGLITMTILLASSKLFG